jgi:protoheme IX farnesyltransferase
MKDLKHENEWGRVMGPVTGVMKLLAAVLLAASPEAWVLYAMVFLWQFPPFMAIAWMYREDYTRAGYLALPLGEQRNRFVIWQSLAVPLALIPLSLILTIVGESGLVYSVGALILGLIFFYCSAGFAFRRSNVAARHLLSGSIVYLPTVFILVMLGKK